MFVIRRDHYYEALIKSTVGVDLLPKKREIQFREPRTILVCTEQKTEYIRLAAGMW